MPLTWLDYAFLLALTISMLAGFLRGLVREALGLGAWIAALLAARVFAQPIGDLLEPYIDHPDVRLVLGFIIVILVVVIACGVVIRVLTAAIEWVGLGFFNRLAGAAFGLARGAAILVIATVVIGLTPLSQIQAWRDAQLRPSFESLRDWAVVQLQSWDVDPSRAQEAMRQLPLGIPGGPTSSYQREEEAASEPPNSRPAP
ncbi:CvpA family protein [Salinicola aestuarinus]|uniref:CvpA family protein n=1 Tax=Salinicola aestuarinus TaxID=1949082 RepID=UPI000DA26508|nr:CvpA family protein [Salinicola aestuarinus]